MKKVFLTLMVCAGLAACTSDDVVIGTTSDSAFNGGDLYMQVFISDVKDGGTRATGTNDNGANSYSNGDKDEYAVNDAEFYFYDKDGVFISRASVWDGGSGTTNDDGSNVTFTSANMIVLKGLTSTQLPKYMVTILNKPSDFEDAGTYDPANTLGELERKTVDDYMNDKYFIMSTSSYTDPTSTTDDATGTTTTTTTRNADNKHYFVTEIEESNFCEEPITSSDLSNAVQVYVERLAAKVEVDVAGSMSGTANTDGYYELDITVGGTANDYDENTGETSSAVHDGVDRVYVKFLGWKLNATARQSYIMKNIDDAWDGGTNYWAGTWNVKDDSWNDATNHRSYWGKGIAYGTGSFPTTNINSTTGVSNTDSDEASATTWLNDYLQYTSLESGLLDIGPAATDDTGDYYGYCAENTNVVDSEGEGASGIKDEYSSGITSVLLKAQAYSYDTESQTYSKLPLVNYDGYYWTVDGFKDEVARTEVYYDIKHVSALATEAGLEGTLASVLEQLVGYMEPELYCATSEIGANWDATSDYIKAFDGSFLGLVDLGNGNVGIWPYDSGTNHSDDTSAEITNKWTPVYTTGTTTEAYPATADLDDYYLYLKITDYNSWNTSISGAVLGSSAVQGADGNYYFYLDEKNTLGSYTYRQFFVRALETQADETNDFFAGISEDEDGSSVTTTTSSSAPNLYYDGLMYYSIPIEHLVEVTASTGSTDPTDPSTSDESEATIVEGQYGVVRNHWYTITITGLSKLGKGISNESAVIVPDPEGVDTWLLPANVNINAWMKLNDQKVSL